MYTKKQRKHKLKLLNYNKNKQLHRKRKFRKENKPRKQNVLLKKRRLIDYKLKKN